ncbi:MAG: UvrD-helicase domain-containing protein [Deltaproteobacteria bacterium]|nr:UvrD-helicase domain-containing protein [Deltaproteobacteria bacterium]
MLDLDVLNQEQAEAVLATEGPLLVLAGAGSGKTRVVTYRLAYLIQGGVHPRHILCVTFTNKAAHEMKDRARALVGASLRGATLSTFHALGARLLRENATRVGLRPGFGIQDSAEQLGTLRRILRDLRIDDRKFDAKLILTTISKAKNAGLDAARFRASEGKIGGAVPSELDDDEYVVAAIEAYTKYEEGLRAQNVVDFDDLLLKTQILLETHEEILDRMRARWHYLMVDEYQDTNGAQFQLLSLLAGETKNLCVVGDDDQSIYGFRGADVGNILRFESDFPGAKVVRLESNYRSTGNILQLANRVIEVSKARHEKRLKPIAGPGEPVRVVSVPDEDAEAELVADRIVELEDRGVVASEIAVLFRSNVQSRAIEVVLRARGIPYRLVGGMDLLDKKEIKDAVAYLRVLDNPDDEQSLRRILNYPPRGIGDTTVERIDAAARERGAHLPDALERAHEIEGVNPRTADSIVSFLHVLAEHRKLLGKRKPSTVAKKLLEAVKLEDALLSSSDTAHVASRRIDNVRGIIRLIERWEAQKKSTGSAEASEDDDEDLLGHEELTLGSFLADLALGAREQDPQKKKGERDDQVILSTIHAAKGLEWEHVMIVGAEEDLLPHARTIEGDGEIDEERRLAYVAITRAKKELVITWSRARSKYGRLEARRRSRFLEGLPEDAFEAHEDALVVARTEEERDAIARKYMAQIRAKLGM